MVNPCTDLRLWLFYFQENATLKEHIEAVIRENMILKRAVAIQHECQKEFDVKNQELQQLKQLVSQYQEKLRTLEVSINNFLFPMLSPVLGASNCLILVQTKRMKKGYISNIGQNENLICFILLVS